MLNLRAFSYKTNSWSTCLDVSLSIYLSQSLSPAGGKYVFAPIRKQRTARGGFQAPLWDSGWT